MAHNLARTGHKTPGAATFGYVENTEEPHSMIHLPETTVEICRGCAIQMREVAERSEGMTRESFLRMAAHWDRLAAEAEAKSGPVPDTA
jgi:hypothetical protein